MSSRPVHFDMTAEDPERMTTFYSKVFGWTFQKWDGPMEYWMADTGKGEPGINGGVSRREPGKPGQTQDKEGTWTADGASIVLTADGKAIKCSKSWTKLSCESGKQGDPALIFVKS